MVNENLIIIKGFAFYDFSDEKDKLNMLGF